MARYGVHSFVYIRCRLFFFCFLVSDCRWSLLTLIGCCQQWQQVSDTVANDRSLLTAPGQAFLPLAGQLLRVLAVRITRWNRQCLKLEGLAIHVNCTTKRGQAFLRVAGRSVTSSDLVSGRKTYVISERRRQARRIVSTVMRGLTTFRSTTYSIYDGGPIRLYYNTSGPG